MLVWVGGHEARVTDSTACERVNFWAVPIMSQRSHKYDLLLIKSNQFG